VYCDAANVLGIDLRRDAKVARRLARRRGAGGGRDLFPEHRLISPAHSSCDERRSLIRASSPS
jgi:hypothetical protein